MAYEYSLESVKCIAMLAMHLTQGFAGVKSLLL